MTKIAKGEDMKEKVKKTKAHTPKAKVNPPVKVTPKANDKPSACTSSCRFSFHRRSSCWGGSETGLILFVNRWKR